jgi:hypothetical protein
VCYNTDPTAATLTNHRIVNHKYKIAVCYQAAKDRDEHVAESVTNQLVLLHPGSALNKAIKVVSILSDCV